MYPYNPTNGSGVPPSAPPSTASPSLLHHAYASLAASHAAEIASRASQQAAEQAKQTDLKAKLMAQKKKMAQQLQHQKIGSKLPSTQVQQPAGANSISDVGTSASKPLVIADDAEIQPTVRTEGTIPDQVEASTKSNAQNAPDRLNSPPTAPTDPDILRCITNLVEFIARSGLAFETTVRSKNHDNPLFQWLCDPAKQQENEFRYYQWKLKEKGIQTEFNQKSFDNQVQQPQISTTGSSSTLASTTAAAPAAPAPLESLPPHSHSIPPHPQYYPYATQPYAGHPPQQGYAYYPQSSYAYDPTAAAYNPAQSHPYTAPYPASAYHPHHAAHADSYFSHHPYQAGPAAYANYPSHSQPPLAPPAQPSLQHSAPVPQQPPPQPTAPPAPLISLSAGAAPVSNISSFATSAPSVLDKKRRFTEDDDVPSTAEPSSLSNPAHIKPDRSRSRSPRRRSSRSRSRSRSRDRDRYRKRFASRSRSRSHSRSRSRSRSRSPDYSPAPRSHSLGSSAFPVSSARPYRHKHRNDEDDEDAEGRPLGLGMKRPGMQHSSLEGLDAMNDYYRKLAERDIYGDQQREAHEIAKPKEDDLSAPFRPSRNFPNALSNEAHAALHGKQVEHAQLDSSNIGHRMLSRMGWTEGTGLGKRRDGIVEPVQALVRKKGAGVGADIAPHQIKDTDDEFTAFRKMQAFKHKPGSGRR